MTTTFIEPGGDTDFQNPVGSFTLWTNGSMPALDTVIVHGSHLRSLNYRPSVADRVQTVAGILSDAGSRISFYVYIKTRPANAVSSFAELCNSGGTMLVAFRLTSGGVLQLWNGTTAQIGSNGATLNTGQWYRISLAYTITSTTVNRFELFVDSVSSISITNATITTIVTSEFRIGNRNVDTALDFRSSDHYIDNSSALTDPGNIWVTAKRPLSNGAVNGFTTQIGSGGSGYGTGHAPQINERPLSTTNGWSMIGAGGIVTEEYTIEGKSVGNMDISTATIVDFMGWIVASSLSSETAKIILASANSNISLTSTTSIFTKIAGSATYPAGNTDVGIITSATLTTVSLYECGVAVAFIPAPITAVFGTPRLLMGVGT